MYKYSYILATTASFVSDRVSPFIRMHYELCMYRTNSNGQDLVTNLKK